MSTTYKGIPNNVANNLPGVVAIASTTNASPIVVTTATAHGLATGDDVNVYGHTTNTPANGQRSVTVISPTTFSLDGSHGTAAGGATGAVQPLTAPGFQIPSDGDDDDAASVDVALEADADRTAFLLTATGAYKIRNIFQQSRNDTLFTSVWSTVNIVSTATPTVFGSPFPIQTLTDCEAFDWIDIELQTASAGADLIVQLYYAFGPFGGSPGSWNKLNGASWNFGDNAGGSCRIRGSVSGIAVTNQVLYIAAYGVGDSGATGTFNLLGDYLLTVTQLRSTNMVQ